jgi:hypothetical protein
MKASRLLISVLSALSLVVAGSAVAVESSASSHGPSRQMGQKMDGGMSCGDMMGMMGEGMMGHGQMMSNLPPGNEKLNLQMHAEMMQAMGAIMQKYADRIVTPQQK